MTERSEVSSQLSTAVSTETFAERNQRLLVAELARVHAVLSGQPAAAAAGVPPESRLARVVELFGLSPFERDLLLWCAGVELDARFPAAFAAAHGDPRRTQPTFALALSLLDGAHWDALSPDRPLRAWRLVELGAGSGIVDRALAIDEPVLHFLAGVTCLDPRLAGILEPAAAPGRLAPAHRAVAAELVTLLDRLPAPATALLDGADPQTRRRVAALVSVEVGRVPLVLRGTQVPAGPDGMALARLVEREVALLGGLLYVDCRDGDEVSTLDPFLGRLGCPVLVGGPARLSTRPAPVRRVLPPLDSADRMALWRGALGEPAADGYGDLLAEVVDHFRLDVGAVEGICAEQAAAGHPAGELRRACRTQGGAGLGDLAEHIPPHAGWDDLVLPATPMAALRDIARQARYRTRVYEDWGMAARSGRGLGLTALFTGESGTGKTLAAEVLAGAIDLDLYRIDLAAVVSKYIGETEKNLRRVFDAAEASGAVLLFDEADALFGKRSEVKDSHDRYANVEVAYLLQRMEAYRGLAILTTNLKTALDRAFLRRIRFVVSFPFPAEAQRAEIWRRMFPPSLPTSGVDLASLARLQIPGGNIHGIAMAAAFLAAEDGGPLRMDHLVRAARREYAKLEKPLTDAETRGWG